MSLQLLFITFGTTVTQQNLYNYHWEAYQMQEVMEKKCLKSSHQLGDKALQYISYGEVF